MVNCNHMQKRKGNHDGHRQYNRCLGQFSFPFSYFLKKYLDVEFEILPLAETGVLVAFDKLSKDIASQTNKDLVDVRLQRQCKIVTTGEKIKRKEVNPIYLKEMNRDFIFGQVFLDVRHRIFGIRLRQPNVQHNCKWKGWNNKKKERKSKNVKKGKKQESFKTTILMLTDVYRKGSLTHHENGSNWDISFSLRFATVPALSFNVLDPSPENVTLAHDRLDRRKTINRRNYVFFAIRQIFFFFFFMGEVCVKDDMMILLSGLPNSPPLHSMESSQFKSNVKLLVPPLFVIHSTF